jgi:hypothetical protein
MIVVQHLLQKNSGEVSVNEKYKILGTSVEAILCLPVSNADCEREQHRILQEFFQICQYQSMLLEVLDLGSCVLLEPKRA